MPARVMRQNEAIKELFRRKIQEKVAREKEKMFRRIDDETPSWIAWALKPVAGISFDMHRCRDNSRGEDGENRAAFNFWLFLSKEWVLVNDVVLEPKPEEFIQLDHVLIGPPGIYLIETKAWEGAFTGYKDNWRRKEGGSWVRCESPTKQNQRHRRLFKHWLENTLGDGIPGEIEAWLFPVVLFTRAKWLRVEECSMPVFESGMALAWHIRRQGKNTVLRQEQLEAIAGALVRVVPLSGQGTPPGARDVPPEGAAANGNPCGCRTETGKTRNGCSYVKVYGKRDDAEEVHLNYKAAGKEPGPLKPDRFTEGAWFFYFTDGAPAKKPPDEKSV